MPAVAETFLVEILQIILYSDFRVCYNAGRLQLLLGYRALIVCRMKRLKTALVAVALWHWEGGTTWGLSRVDTLILSHRFSSCSRHTFMSSLPNVAFARQMLQYAPTCKTMYLSSSPTCALHAYQMSGFDET
jgi:hypothetical protein